MAPGHRPVVAPVPPRLPTLVVRHRKSVAGFTLVEIMVVVTIIGLLAALGVPAFLRAQKKSQAATLTNDFRQFDSAFQRYLTENGTAPPAAAVGVVPTGMAGYLPDAYTKASPLGGGYQWSGPSANIVLTGSNADDTLMLIVDTALDDGNLTTGNFTKISSTMYGMWVH